MSGKIGRPTVYTEALGEKICDMVSTGASLATICARLNISLSMVFNWTVKMESFRDAYAHARENAADYLVEEIVEIADNEDLPPDSRRVKIEARKWLASKLKPKRYSDKMVFANDPDNPIGSLALRLDTAINHHKTIDVTPSHVLTIQDMAADLI